MKSYRVVWEIDIDAKSPKEAAKKALKIQRDKSSMATVFDVIDRDSKSVKPPVRIDLNVEEVI